MSNARMHELALYERAKPSLSKSGHMSELVDDVQFTTSKVG